MRTEPYLTGQLRKTWKKTEFVGLDVGWGTEKWP